jgi:hypothetical protein
MNDQVQADNTELMALRKDAERYRHCKAHGHPIKGPQCVAWTSAGRMVLGDTQEEAIDNAMASAEQA